MHERKTLMADMSDAFVGLPGGMGTFDELVEIVTWAQLGLHAKPVVLANIDNYFEPLYAMLDHAVREGFVTAESRARWRNADSVDVGHANPYERRACRRGNSLTCRAPALEFAPSPGSGNSSVGRARPCQGRGREFESRFPLQILRYLVRSGPWLGGRMVMQRPAKPSMPVRFRP